MSRRRKHIDRKDIVQEKCPPEFEYVFDTATPFSGIRIIPTVVKRDITPSRNQSTQRER